jgi:hypothetical protein
MDGVALERVAGAIEVTTAMIEAGKRPIEERWLEFTGPEGGLLWDEVLREVFLAMWGARHKS